MQLHHFLSITSSQKIERYNSHMQYNNYTLIVRGRACDDQDTLT